MGNHVTIVQMSRRVPSLLKLTEVLVPVMFELSICKPTKAKSRANFKRSKNDLKHLQLGCRFPALHSTVEKQEKPLVTKCRLYSFCELGMSLRSVEVFDFQTSW